MTHRVSKEALLPSAPAVQVLLRRRRWCWPARVCGTKLQRDRGQGNAALPRCCTGCEQCCAATLLQKCASARAVPGPAPPAQDVMRVVLCACR